MKPIETSYNGCKFRSRLEARWAVFFDTLGIQWEYEKEGYDLGDGILYLPDFWLPEQQIWFEVKGKFPTFEEYQKSSLLCQHSEKYVCLAIEGMKLPVRCSQEEALDGRWTRLHLYHPDAKEFLLDIPYPYPIPCAWCECPTCHKFEIVEDGLLRFMSCSCITRRKQKIINFMDNMVALFGDVPVPPDKVSKDWATQEEKYKERALEQIDHEQGHDSPRLIAAYTAARQARFEHGKKGI
jgi:hypothetical protein